MRPYKPMWEVKQQADPGVLDLYIYGYVEDETYVDDGWLGHWVESENSANHLRQVLSEHPNVTQINVHINSRGGSVVEGTAIYNLLKRHAAHKTAYIDCWACSIASVIAMACDEVVMPRNTLMFLHEMSMVAAGTSAQLRKAADDLEIMNATGRSAYLLKAGDKLTEERLIEIEAAETWLTAQECVELGLADRVEDYDSDMTPAQEYFKRANQNLEQMLQTHQQLSAQLRQLTNQATPAEPTPAADPVPNPQPEPGPEPTPPAEPPQPQQNTILNLFSKI